MACHIAMIRVPLFTTHGCDIEEVPDGRIGINAAIVVIVKLRANGVAVIDRAVRRAREDAQAGIL